MRARAAKSGQQILAFHQNLRLPFPKSNRPSQNNVRLFFKLQQVSDLEELNQLQGNIQHSRHLQLFLALELLFLTISPDIRVYPHRHGCVFT